MIHQLGRVLKEERYTWATAEKEVAEARKKTEQLEAKVKKMRLDILTLQTATVWRDEASLQRLILETIRPLLAELSGVPTPPVRPPPTCEKRK